MSVDLTRVPPFYHGYINKVAGNDLAAAFTAHRSGLTGLLNNIPPDQWGYRYAAGKWSIKELVQHVIDAERIFACRALCFARKDRNELPGFDEDMYAANAKADRRSKAELTEELAAVQRSSALLFGSFDGEQLAQEGIANGRPVYVKAIGYIIIGHGLHHKEILEQRYLHL